MFLEREAEPACAPLRARRPGTLTDPTLLQALPAIFIESRVSVELIDIVYPGADFIAGEVYVVGGGGYDFIGLNLELSGDEGYSPDSSILLVKNMLCSKLLC